MKKNEKRTVVQLARFIYSLFMLLQSRVALFTSSHTQILWKHPSSNAHAVTIHCKVVDVTSSHATLVDYTGSDEDAIECISSTIRQHFTASWYLQYEGALVVSIVCAHGVALTPQHRLHHAEGSASAERNHHSRDGAPAAPCVRHGRLRAVLSAMSFRVPRPHARGADADAGVRATRSPELSAGDGRGGLVRATSLQRVPGSVAPFAPPQPPHARSTVFTHI